jgi:hypothetical protein
MECRGWTGSTLRGDERCIQNVSRKKMAGLSFWHAAVRKREQVACCYEHGNEYWNILMSGISWLSENEGDQSVHQQATGWMVFESQQGQNISLLHVVQTRTETHTVSPPVSIGGCFYRRKGQGREAGHSPATSHEISIT